MATALQTLQLRESDVQQIKASKHLPDRQRQAQRREVYDKTQQEEAWRPQGTGRRQCGQGAERSSDERERLPPFLLPPEHSPRIPNQRALLPIWKTARLGGLGAGEGKRVTLPEPIKLLFSFGLGSPGRRSPGYECSPQDN